MQVFTCVMSGVDDDAVFKALADPTRRALRDRLRERNGQTLGELCGPLAMARQSATQHLGVLEAANLITTVRSGRTRLHYLNPVPLRDIAERWIEKFERPRLRTLSQIPSIRGNLARDDGSAQGRGHSRRLCSLRRWIRTGWPPR
jgi:DNA-binding transcriptional ArsR family regulator